VTHDSEVEEFPWGLGHVRRREVVGGIDAGLPAGRELSPSGYVTYLDIQLPHLHKAETPALVDAVTDPWFNERLCRIKGSVARLSALQGERQWHEHDQ